MATIDEDVPMHGSQEPDHPHGATRVVFNFVESLQSPTPADEVPTMFDQAAPDDSLVESRNVFRKMVKP